MANILFANAYYYWLDSKQMETGQPYPPLGTAYAASYLRTKGHQVQIHDNNLVDNRSEILKKLNQLEADFLVIYDDGFNYLTKMCLTSMREATYGIIKSAKERGYTVIMNSSDSTDHYEDYHKVGADYIIHGEGEFSLEELVSVVSANESVENVLGISYIPITTNTVKKNPARPVVKNLDQIPMAAWDLLEIDSYRKIWEKEHGYFSLNLATTRGCPFKCNWCAKPIYGNRYNSRSPENVIDEIAYLIDSYGVKHFWMCDDIFGLKPNWVQEFNRLRKEKGLDFRYKIQSRVDLMLKEDQIEALAESGVETVWVGAESGSQKILDAMDKGTQVQQIYDATKILKSKNVRVAFFLQFGYIDETWEDIKKTIKMVLDLMPDDIGISVSYPLPGTLFYERVKKDLKSKSNWTDSDDLDMMFQNTYPAIFYKTLHRYVHNRYRIKKALLGASQLFKHPIKNTVHIMRGIYHLPQALLNKILLQKHITANS